MLNVNALKAEMVRYGYNNEKLAKKLGISTKTLSTRFKTGDFGSREIGVMIECCICKIQWISFFAPTVTYKLQMLII